MQHIQLSFPVTGTQREILIAQLAEAGCAGFEETDELLIASFPEDGYNEAIINTIAAESDTTFSKASLPQQNWNAAWEASFEPVVVPGFCTVRAGFHPPATDTPYEIIITPKMSFGTGHHATTRLMMMAMKNIPFKHERVLDFGTGTGILAILASKLEGAEVVAIDTDEWSVENALENIDANGANNVVVRKGSLDIIPAHERFDVILANINRHILLQYMADMHAMLTNDGDLLLSGILKSDEAVILEAAEKAGFSKMAMFRENDWIVLQFTA